MQHTTPVRLSSEIILEVVIYTNHMTNELATKAATLVEFSSPLSQP